MKRTVRTLISAAFIMALVSIMMLAGSLTANAAVIDSGECGKNLTWTLDDEGTLTISGEGEMDNYYVFDDYAPWLDCAGQIKKLVINSGVTSIGWYSFSDCTSLTSVIIPDSVTYIGEDVFSGCTSLTSVIIPDSVTYIGDAVFSGCTSLASINIPYSVTSIGESAFDGTAYYNNQSNWENRALYIDDCLIRADNDISGSCTIKNGTRIIANSAFYRCESLASVDIPNSVTSIGRSAFVGCTSLASVDIPNSVTSIGSNAFIGCTSLASVDIPNSVTSISDGMFYGCTSLASVDIPNSVTSIGSNAFSECTSLLSIVNILDNITSISDGMFSGCESLASVNIPDNITSIGSFAFSGCESLASVDIPDNITSIGSYAFSGCESLASVDIPNSVTSIGWYSFSDCTSLASVNIPNSVTSISDGMFSGCTSLVNVNISNSVTSISRRAFYKCTSLASMIIPDSVTYIGDDVFSGCTSLASIHLPRSVINIDGLAFNACSSFKDVYYSGTEEEWEKITVGAGNIILRLAKIHFNCAPISRLAGQGRVDTAVEISKKGWESSDTAIIAYGMNYADALAAAPLAAGLDCPILLTINPQNGLESTIFSELSRLGVKKVYLIGGTYVISENIETSLKEICGSENVVRLAGIGRYETSIEIAKELLNIRQQKGMGDFTNAYFCSAGSFADALAISPVAGIELNPILYAPQKGQSLRQANAAMYDFVGQLGTKNTTIIGGIYAVSEDAQSDIAAKTGKAPERVDAGLTGGRYDTMLNVCTRYRNLFGNESICVATGADFPDALAGSAFASKNKCPIILVGYIDAKKTQTSISPLLKSFIGDMNPTNCFVLGGEYAVPSSQVETLLA